MVNLQELLDKMAADPFMMVPHFEVTELVKEVARYRSTVPVGYVVNSPNLLQPHFVKDENTARRLAALGGVNVTVIEALPGRVLVYNVLDEKAASNE